MPLTNYWADIEHYGLTISTVLIAISELLCVYTYIFEFCILGITTSIIG